ncbi:MAG TPA: peptidoglycan-associated lipoprotein Pal [Methylomirabilota bacterium]|jgi:peptidoglycan-associated lipoprotein
MLKAAGVGLTAVLVAGVIVAGCARRPATTATAAPAPTGVSSNTPGTMAPTTSTLRRTASPQRAATSRPSTMTPAVVRPPVNDFATVPELTDVYFEFDKYDIGADGARALDGNARWLRSNRDLVLIEGHCDARGTNEYNVALGERRAKAAMNYLVAQGVAASRITIVSYGEERPQCTQSDEACWSKNRRAHFLVKPQ